MSRAVTKVIPIMRALRDDALLRKSSLLDDREQSSQYPSSHHPPTKLATDNFCYTASAPSGFESLLNRWHKTKEHPLKVGVLLFGAP